MTKQNGIIYKPLEIDFQISEELQKAIEDFINCINSENSLSEDCYRSEIDFWIKDEKNLTGEQYHLLREYYTFGGIFKNG